MSSSFTQNESDRSATVLEDERTLRLIAKLPAPEGIEDRVKAKLRSAPRRSKVIAWPFSTAVGKGWMQSAGARAAAAAAIVLVIGGGGWEIYSHIRPAALPTTISAPQPLNGAGAFNAAGAKRVPQTLEGPVVVTPVNKKVKPESTGVIAKKQHKRPAVKKNAEPTTPER
jgi:hypothetical protein